MFLSDLTLWLGRDTLMTLSFCTTARVEADADRVRTVWGEGSRAKLRVGDSVIKSQETRADVLAVKIYLDAEPWPNTRLVTGAVSVSRLRVVARWESWGEQRVTMWPKPTPIIVPSPLHSPHSAGNCLKERQLEQAQLLPAVSCHSLALLSHSMVSSSGAVLPCLDWLEHHGLDTWEVRELHLGVETVVAQLLPPPYPRMLPTKALFCNEIDLDHNMSYFYNISKVILFPPNILHGSKTHKYFNFNEKIHNWRLYVFRAAMLHYDLLSFFHNVCSLSISQLTSISVVLVEN